MLCCTLLYRTVPYYFRHDAKHSDVDVIYIECFCMIAMHMRDNASTANLKQMLIKEKILADAIEYITLLAPPVKTLLA